MIKACETKLPVFLTFSNLEGKKIKSVAWIPRSDWEAKQILNN